MKIIKNKQIISLIYKKYINTVMKIDTLRNGEILDVIDLTPPMRGDIINLSNIEQHIIFYNGTETLFIPSVDIIYINYD